MTKTLVAIALGVLVLPTVAVAQEWTERHNDNGIQVWTASFGESRYKQFKGTAVIDGALDDVLAVVTDVEQYEAWFPNTPDARLLDHTDNVFTYYIVTDLPWPVTSRDTVYQYRLARTGDGAILTVSVTPDGYPEQDGLVRVQASSGQWTFTSVEGGTQVTWQLHFDPNGSIPAWLANTGVVNTPAEMLAALRSHVAAIQ